MSGEKYEECNNCGHSHNPKEACSGSFCYKCGIGGNLSTQSCNPEMNDTLANAIREIERTGSKGCRINLKTGKVTCY
jgi:hypothetical protein